MLTLAITGGIACGKTLAGQMVAEMGVPVCEADEVARGVLAKGEPVRERVVVAFGPDVVTPDGEIDRAALARRVFGDPAKLERLNALMHPEIMRRLRDWVAQQQAGGASCVAVVIPLLYEVRDEAQWDVVICVAAPDGEQRRRLAERGMSDEEAEARVRSQLPLSGKMEKAQYVIFNGGSKQMLQEQIERVMRSIRGGYH